MQSSATHDRKENTMPFVANLMRSQVLYRAAQLLTTSHTKELIFVVYACAPPCPALLHSAAVVLGHCSSCFIVYLFEYTVVVAVLLHISGCK